MRLYNTFHDKGFDLYAVAMDSDKAKWIEAIKKYKSTWTNVSDLLEWESEAVKIYNVNRTPGIYLLDKEGRIMAKNLRGKELKMKIEEILKGEL